MPYDELGRWIPASDLGMEPAPLPTYPQKPDLTDPITAAAMDNQSQEPPPPPPQYDAPKGPTADQYTLQDRFGIKTYGPNQDAGQKKIDAYKSDIDQAEDVAGQGKPQQYGVSEPLGMDAGPLSGADAASAFLNKYPNARRDPNRHMETPQEIRDRNAAYDQYVQADRAKRDEERTRLRERGAQNRMDAREKDADAWQRFGMLNSIGGGPSGPGGPSMVNAGGALLLGPGFGAPPWGKYGPRVNIDPLGEDKLQLRREQEDRLRRQGMTKEEIERERLGLGRRTADIKEAGIQGTQNRFDTVEKRKIDAAAEADRLEMDKGVKRLMEQEQRAHQLAGSKFEEGVGEDLVPWKRFVKGPDFQKYADTDFTAKDPATGQPGLLRPGSFGNMADRTLMLARKLKALKQKGVNIGDISPEVGEFLSRLAQERGFE